MNKQTLKKLIDVAAGRKEADTVIKNGKVVDVFTGEITAQSVAICEGMIAGIGDYHCANEMDALGAYILPGLIDSHIHIESSFVTPEEIGRLLVPHGTTTIISDPHEIVNVAGKEGLDYMLEAAENTVLDIKYMLPSCVPSTPFEHSGAFFSAEDMESMIFHPNVLGIGEYMNFVGVVNGTSAEIDKLSVGKDHQRLIDGHCPGIHGKDLNAYTAAGITTDHECTSVEEMQEKIGRGMYVLLRQGSASQELAELLPGVTPRNSRRCLLCSDDRQPKTIFEEGHIDGLLRICVKNGLDPITAIQMATLNPAECYGLSDRGAIAPGRRADLVLVHDLKDFHVHSVWSKGRIVAQDGKYLLPVERKDFSKVSGSVNLGDFTADRLRLQLKASKVHAIEIQPKSIVTKKVTVEIQIDEKGDFRYDPEKDICKLAVIERHHRTGAMGIGLLKNYGITSGAVAISVAHDSHNVITAGTCNEDMALAVKTLENLQGGIALVKEGKILDTLPLPVAGIMSDRSGEWVDEKLKKLHQTAFEVLGINESIDPFMTLCFMALPVIPEVKLTDLGLFDVSRFDFIPIEAE